MSYWTPICITRLTNLVTLNGESPTDVARKLGFDVSEVISKARELELEWNPRWQIVESVAQSRGSK